mmetsp:Transcript_10059/g.20155  ORF Transcript_10059/g.20155 Transcript_10059/m.20155 type:complete len:376 (+) Transcript_10059:854-1981(+)
MNAIKCMSVFDTYVGGARAVAGAVEEEDDDELEEEGPVPEAAPEALPVAPDSSAGVCLTVLPFNCANFSRLASLMAVHTRPDPAFMKFDTCKPKWSRDTSARLVRAWKRALESTVISLCAPAKTPSAERRAERAESLRGKRGTLLKHKRNFSRLRNFVAAPAASAAFNPADSSSSNAKRCSRSTRSSLKNPMSAESTATATSSAPTFSRLIAIVKFCARWAATTTTSLDFASDSFFLFFESPSCPPTFDTAGLELKLNSIPAVKPVIFALSFSTSNGPPNKVLPTHAAGILSTYNAFVGLFGFGSFANIVAVFPAASFSCATFCAFSPATFFFKVASSCSATSLCFFASAAAAASEAEDGGTCVDTAAAVGEAAD